MSEAAGARSGFWTELPRWLWRRWATARHRSDRPALIADVLQAQEDVLRAVRLRDDLLDGQDRRPESRAEADRRLLEAESTLDECLGPWAVRVCRDLVEVTTGAILEVRELQLRPRGMAAGALDLYARVNAVFELGSVLILRDLDRASEIPAVTTFCAHLGIAGQIVDDLEDVEEDLDQGRLNWVASRLLEDAGIRSGLTSDRRRPMARSLIRGQTAARLLREIRGRLTRAREAVTDLDLAEADPFMDDLFAQVDGLERRLHLVRVRCALPGTES